MRKPGFLTFSFFLLILFLVVSSAGLSQRPLHGGGQVSVLGWGDDSHYILRTFDLNKNPVLQKVDIKTGKGVLIPEWKSEREELAESLPAGTMISMADAISEDMRSIAVMKDNDLYYFTKGNTQLTRLTNDQVPEVNARFSPEGTKLAYTKNKDLYVFDILNKKEIRITSDATDRIYNGYSSWVYMEEILGRPGKYAAFWWSPDGNRLAFLRTDETEVPLFHITRLDEPDGIHGTLEVVPYPKPGDPNPRVRMGIAEVATARTVWVKTDYTIDQYLAWPFWTPDSRNLAIQVVNRDQNDLKIILADVATGDFRQIYNENNNTWVDFHEDIHVMKNGGGFILRSYRSGWENLYYYGWDGNLISQITNLDFRVTSLDKVDEIKKLVYFSATGPESTESHGFRVGLDGKDLIRITKGEGTHALNISPEGSYFIDTWSSIASAGSILAYDRRGRLLREIHRMEQPAFDPAQHSRTELVRIPTSDGLFNMPALITYPVNFDPSRKYPVVFTIYGGPDSRNVHNIYKGSDPSFYAMNGIITISVDHRGSGQFGKKGLDYMYRNLGKWEILDYADAVEWLRGKPWVDPERIGITGSSYGGYMTCLALTKGADYWTHGIAVMPVTDWRLYDNIYTERYMDTPRDNPEGYRQGSVMNFIRNYKGKMYIIHGDVDDNVHMQNTIRLVSGLQDAGKEFQLMIYPGNRHGIQGSKALHFRNESHDFWLRYFKEN